MTDPTAEHNRAHFDAHAHTYDTQHAEGLQLLTEELRSRIAWLNLPTDRPIRMLDYACGTGLVSHALAPHVSEIVAIDLSPAMVSHYNARATPHMHAHVGNITSDPTVLPEFTDFDLIAVALGFHHFANPGLAAQRLAARLRPGGTLLIVDNVGEENGFTREGVERMFGEAGVGEGFGWEVLDRELRVGRGEGAWRQRVFVARGVKA